jgi:hypothetical protein
LQPVAFWLAGLGRFIEAGQAAGDPECTLGAGTEHRWRRAAVIRSAAGVGAVRQPPQASCVAGRGLGVTLEQVRRSLRLRRPTVTVTEGSGMAPRVPEALDNVVSGALQPVPPLFQGALLAFVIFSHRTRPLRHIRRSLR